MKVLNRNTTKIKRINLRKRLTESEEILWQYLRARRFHNLKFFRQYGIGEYIADFYCPQLKLVIELDGEIHDLPNHREYDKVRDDFMKNLNILVVRFRNKEIIDNIETVLEKLEIIISNRNSKI
jgi:very-short-patch-repair endonuclease